MNSSHTKPKLQAKQQSLTVTDCSFGDKNKNLDNVPATSNRLCSANAAAPVSAGVSLQHHWAAVFVVSVRTGACLDSGQKRKSDYCIESLTVTPALMPSANRETEHNFIANGHLLRHAGDPSLRAVAQSPLGQVGRQR